MRQYIFNLETTKIELHFEKSEYNALTGKVITRKPKKSYNGDWCFSIDDSYTNTFHKAAKVSEAGYGHG